MQSGQPKTAKAIPAEIRSEINAPGPAAATVPGSNSASGPIVSIGQYSTAGKKASNDDSYGVLRPDPPLLASKGIAMAIADGMSSSDAAKEASENCVKSFLDDYFCTHVSWSVKKSVGVVLQAINSWLHAQGQMQYLSHRGMVTTFSGLVLKAGTVHIFHAGDSRICCLRDGLLQPLTRDHRVQVGRGTEHLSRAFGIDQYLEIDYRTEPVETGDVLLFTTDGVHDFLSPQDQQQIITEAEDDLDAAARRIVEAAFAQGSDDNLTCQIVRIENPGTVDETSHLRALTTLPFPPILTAGMRLENFQILRELHASNRTQIYLAREEGTGATVVLKTPSVTFEDDPQYIEMFSREEWVGQLIDSPHVLKVLRALRPRRHLYYVTEYFEGRTLRQWMQDNPHPELETVRGIIDQIAKGLRAFHRKEIIHQDLKPDNVMIDAAGLVKIIDFGSSHAAGLEELASPIDLPTLVGTIDYTAPEYHLGHKPTNRADIYALGVIAYEMLSGRLPYGKGFSGPRDVARAEYRPARQYREDIPLWMDAALRKAIATQPAQRTEALSALSEDLRRPNHALGFDRPRALLERNPTAFWKAIAIAALLANIVLAVMLAR